MMNDFQAMVRILVAVKAGQDSHPFDCALVDVKVLKIEEAQRDRIAIRLQKEDYIDGLNIENTIDNSPPVIFWSMSRPELTIRGMEYLETNQAAKKVLAEIKSIGIDIASKTLSNTVSGMLP